ncbi:Piso0_001866 [Millerozyma farinosa CBS 7064]|uniref:Endoplasmic reticulum transmembrane protein n=1 Tax=Pichia sorbitophila (strain ATCC MYA-4447 / BCRC 22081 / CBS 7064 / NBRC 10061 / NRRL Y-12695) TaxID=559304 RepID=G8YPA9_PICSO|nr:Piso0_001866 [Millerozyma farinosa CBS 7064]
MSIQMSLIFGTLLLQMTALLVSLLPLPLKARKAIVNIAESLKSSKNFNIGLWFSLILLGLQFADCFNRLQRFSHIGNPYLLVSSRDIDSSSISYDQLASKFYSQRNLYLTGAVLYLTLAINTVLGILKNLVTKASEYNKISSHSTEETESSEAEKLRSEIKSKEASIKGLKKQIEGLQTSYDSLNESKPVSKED